MRVQGSRVEGLGLSGFVEVRALMFVVFCIWGLGCRVRFLSFENRDIP